MKKYQTKLSCILICSQVQNLVFLNPTGIEGEKYLLILYLKIHVYRVKAEY